MTDGLALLTQQREQRKRSIPPPRHPARPAVRSLPSHAPEDPPEPALDAPTPDAVADSPSNSEPAPAPEPTHEDLTELYRSTIYFGQAEDRFLEDVRTVARRAKPKVDATRSAVVRMAVRRMLADLTPGEVMDALRAQAPQNTGAPGRRRL
jgi:hypothetical protein